MFLFKRALLLSLCGLMGFAGSAFAQDNSEDDYTPVTESAPVASHVKKPVRNISNHWQVRPGLAFWQESIDLKNGPDTAKMETQSEGILVDAGYVITKSRWRQIYGLELGNGRIKGKGNTSVIPDELRGQVWLILGASASLMYRSSAFSEIGLIAPFHYRTISWTLKDDSGLNPDRDTSFSLGLGLAYVARFNKRESLHLALIKHYFWEATMWTAAWQLEFF